ncbi:glycoside hydrolase family 88 protein [Diaminobutyricibacter sp. McL0618]|uniref:glycoside hydrolase family 88 protein n=1 Tax=Leifsonia sp. McL0618 TaxID=3415677 RepID=UPI003CEDE80D
MTAILSDEFLELVSRRTLRCDIRIWGFGVGPALVGLLRAGALLDEPCLVDMVEALVAPSLTLPADPTDHLISVETLLELQRIRPGLDVGPAIERFRVAVTRAQRPIDNQPPVHRPDLDALAHIIWVDCMHTDGPGLAALGLEANAVSSAEEVAAVLQDDSGLFSHAYDIVAGRANGVHWGRGQGWALHGLVLGGSSQGLTDRLDRLLLAMASLEVDGQWRTVVDDASAPVEASVSAIMASGILLGVSQGRVSGDWLPMARRALIAAANATDADGGLNVSEATPASVHADYLTRASGIFPWGQGPLLLALAEGRKHL